MLSDCSTNAGGSAIVRLSQSFCSSKRNDAARSLRGCLDRVEEGDGSKAPTSSEGGREGRIDEVRPFLISASRIRVRVICGLIRALCARVRLPGPRIHPQPTCIRLTRIRKTLRPADAERSVFFFRSSRDTRAGPQASGRKPRRPGLIPRTCPSSRPRPHAWRRGPA